MKNKILKSRFILNLSSCIFTLFAAVFQSFVSTADAKAELSGIISSMTISSKENPIIVNKNITIPPKGHFVIRKGCKLFFKPNTGIIVEGRLSIEGTKSDPVIFTSINDSIFPQKTGQKANPFDWNGIIINKNAQDIVLKNFVIKFSIYGIESFRPDIRIENGKFIRNGQFHFTMNNKVMPVSENIFYNYKNEKRRDTKKGDTKKREDAIKKDQKDQSVKTAGILPSVKATIIGGGTAFFFMTYYLHQKSEYVALYRNAKSQAMRREYFEQQKPLARNATISCIIGSALLSSGGILYFLDHNRKNEKRISLCPIIGEEQGILATIDF